MSLNLPTLANTLLAGNVHRLIEELAAGLRPPGDIWRENGVKDKATAQKIMAIPAVQEMYLEAKAEWNSRKNMRERIKVRSLAAIEHGLLDLYSASVSDRNPLSSRVDAFKFFAKLGGIEAEDRAGMVGSGGGGVSIRIDLSGGPGDEHVVMIDGSSPDFAPAIDGDDPEPGTAASLPVDERHVGEMSPDLTETDLNVFNRIVDGRAFEDDA